MEISCTANVSEEYAASIFRVKVIGMRIVIGKVTGLIAMSGEGTEHAVWANTEHMEW
jgi:hypothetical protein